MNTHKAVTEERKTEKSLTLFYNRFFYKVLQNDNQSFFISQPHSKRNFRCLISGISKGETGNGI